MNNILQPSHKGIRGFHNSNNTKQLQCSTKMQSCVAVGYDVKSRICKINLFNLPKSRRQLLSKSTSPSKLSLKLHMSYKCIYKLCIVLEIIHVPHNLLNQCKCSKFSLACKYLPSIG
jgi:hypothetical protein